MSDISDFELNHSWNVYYHSSDSNWDFSSYKSIMKIKTGKDLISFNENVPENIIKYAMLFVMKEGVHPTWEDPKNINGGCFSYKVLNTHVVDVWKKMMYALCGETIIANPHTKHVNGITISPKRNFCILKIWLDNKEMQNPEMILDIPNLSKTGVIFKSHSG